MANLFGTGINQIPTNGMLGNLAFQDKSYVGVDAIGIGTTFVDSGTASQPLQVTGGAYVSGNIGIGTTNPTSPLHVVGTALITGITTVGLGSTSTPPSNSQLSFELTSDTNLRFKVRGSDGVLRSGNITLA
jgi:hypothetical protein